jgi:CBS domain-containing protein
LSSATSFVDQACGIDRRSKRGKNMPIATILKRKAFHAAVVAPTDRISDVVRVLSTERAEAALVVDRIGQLLGIVAEHDIVESLAANGAAMLEMTAGQLVTRALHHATPRTSLQEAMRVMIGSRLHHLPVMDQGELIGLISMADVVRALVIEEHAALAA